MEGQGHTLGLLVTPIPCLKHESKPKPPAQVRPPVGNTTPTSHDAPNHEIESHDTISPGLDIKKNPVEDAKDDADKRNGAQR